MTTVCVGGSKDPLLPSPADAHKPSLAHHSMMYNVRLIGSLLGQNKSDNITRIIQLTNDFCAIYLQWDQKYLITKAAHYIIRDPNKWRSLYNVSVLSGFLTETE